MCVPASVCVCVRARERACANQDLARKRLRETARPNYYLHMWGEAKYFQVSTLEHPPPAHGTGPRRTATYEHRRGTLGRLWDSRFLPFAVSGIPASSYSPLVGFLLCAVSGIPSWRRTWDSFLAVHCRGGVSGLDAIRLPACAYFRRRRHAAMYIDRRPHRPLYTLPAIYRSAAAPTFI